ncbi:MAG: aldehyde ferredoxin oxidoreductase [Chloroflexota bacterium]|nr:MAG: aldehyde ferredoxin oxidoreductase [Chloroflexota bacterium]
MEKLLVIDLTEKSYKVENIDPEMARRYIGGSGLSARLLYDRIKLDIDPLGPENPLMFMTGPLVGTSMPSAGRCAVSARSPLTGFWGESNTGGFIGPEMRFAGFDGVLINGRADKPCWVSVLDNKVKFHDAAPLWGQDTYQTQDSIKEILADPKARVACIGPAGENLVKMAAIVNDHGRAAGRTGMGAVMGSKNFKAIAFRGSGKVHLADPAGYKEVVGEILQTVKDDLSAQAFQLAGTSGYVDMATMFGDMPAGYYQVGEWEESSNLSGILLAEEHLIRGTSCYRCPIACGRETRTVKYKVDKVDGPEYETIASFGSLALVDDLEGVIYAGHLCNVYGLDTISTGSTIAMVCDLFDKGILDAEQTGGLEIRFGDVEMSHRLIEMTAKREGFGKLIAEGSAALAAHYGVPEMAATVRNLEIPMHDARSFSGMAPVYALSPRGACHLQGDMYGVDLGMAPATELGIHPGERFENSLEKGQTTARSQSWRSVYNALTVCHFMNPGASKIQRALNAATGWDYSLDELMLSGKRIFSLKRIINHNLGSTIEDDRLPEFMLKSFSTGGTLGFEPDLKPLLAGAYKEHGWDPGSGLPTPEAVKSYGLEFTKPDLP